MVKVANWLLRYVAKMKYLGVTMGEGISFLFHVKGIRNKIISLAMKLKRVMKQGWGNSADYIIRSKCLEAHSSEQLHSMTTSGDTTTSIAYDVGLRDGCQWIYL